MTRYVAFLRGINVGGHRVSMARLRALFMQLKFSNVATFIASGNVIFEASGGAAALESRIEKHLQQALGYDVDTFLRTPAELAAVAAFQPFPDGDGHRLYVCFLREPPGSEHVKTLLSHRSATDDLHVRGREVYWLCRGPSAESLVPWPSLARMIPSTMRNVTTVRKLSALTAAGKSAMHKFKTKVVAGGEGGAWMLLMIPKKVSDALGSKGRVAVAGTVNGFPIKTSVFPHGDGTHHLMFNKAMQKGAAATAGDTVAVELQANSRT